MAQENKALMTLMHAADELIRAHENGEKTPPIEVIHQVVISPGEGEVRLPTRTDSIRIIECEINGDTVPFDFNSTTGTLDLPEHLRGGEVKVTYTSLVRDPYLLRRTYEEIHRQETVRLRRKPSWKPAPPQPELIVVGETGLGPYRSAPLVRYEPQPEKLPWYKRLWHWLTKCRRWK
jgi:hypothetical protein